MENILKFILAIVATIIFISFTKNILAAIFSMENNSLHKKRLKQLQFTNKRTSSNDKSTLELINTLTKPAMNYLIPKMNLNNMSQLEKDLESSQWNKYFTPVTFIAMDITLKAIGIIVGLILLPAAWQIALVWSGLFIFVFKFLFKNSIKERKFRLLSEFPEFIKNTEGYLSSGIPLTKAMEHALPYVGPEWRVLVQEFIVNSEIYSQEQCIDILSSKVDIFEVKELWSLIKLNSQQGIDIKECFSNQAAKVKEMKLEAMMGKVSKRQVMSIAIQGPLLLIMIVSFGLPTFASMLNLGF